MSKTLSKHDVLELVKRYVAARQPVDYKLTVQDDIRFISDGLVDPYETFYVVVQADRDLEHRWSYYDKLSEIEDAIQANENVNVMLTPVMPG
jgi:hypothetical protein